MRCCNCLYYCLRQDGADSCWLNIGMLWQRLPAMPTYVSCTRNHALLDCPGTVCWPAGLLIAGVEGCCRGVELVRERHSRNSQSNGDHDLMHQSTRGSWTGNQCLTDGAHVHGQTTAACAANMSLGHAYSLPPHPRQSLHG